MISCRLRFRCRPAAGNVRNDADFFILIPRTAAGEISLMAIRGRKACRRTTASCGARSLARPTRCPVTRRDRGLGTGDRCSRSGGGKTRLSSRRPRRPSARAKPRAPSRTWPIRRRHQQAGTRPPPARSNAPSSVDRQGPARLEARIDLHGMFQDEAHGPAACLHPAGS